MNIEMEHTAEKYVLMAAIYHTLTGEQTYVVPSLSSN